MKLYFKLITILLLIFSTFMSVGWSLDCDEGYTDIDEECYYQSDLDVLQQFIDNSQESYIPPPSNMRPIDLGVQDWENGRIVFLCYSFVGESECHNYDYVLSGEIPMEIGNLVELRNLILSWSQLSGEIPHSIGDLINLTELKLQYNELSGEIPHSIGDLINLTDLYLRENQLTGAIPLEIWNLINLDRLYLEYNDLNGEIPDSIDNLVYLRYCNLKHNRFSGQIPESIGNFENIIGLSLAHNHFSGMIPESICNLIENSNFIYLYGNYLCPPYPECLTEEQLHGTWGEEDAEQNTSECIECSEVSGDANNDGLVNILDALFVVNCILLNTCDECSDLNYDEIIDILDIVLIIDYILGI